MLQGDSLPAKPQGKPKNTGVGSLSLLQQIFLTQESNWDLLHRRCILYHLSYEGSPTTLEGGVSSNTKTQMKGEGMASILNNQQSTAQTQTRSFPLSFYRHQVNKKKLAFLTFQSLLKVGAFFSLKHCFTEGCGPVKS